MKINELEQNVSIFINNINKMLNKANKFDVTYLKFRIAKLKCIFMDL